MPWPVDAPLYNFNEFSIMLNAEPQFGVYALFNAEKQLVLMDAGAVQLDLMRLAEASGRFVHLASPIYFSYVLTPCEKCMEVKERLLHGMQLPLADREFAAD
jgi:hypothetical protein